MRLKCFRNLVKVIALHLLCSCIRFSESFSPARSRQAGPFWISYHNFKHRTKNHHPHFGVGYDHCRHRPVQISCPATTSIRSSSSVSLSLSVNDFAQRTKNKAVAISRNFHYGWLQVHNNYLRIYWKLWTTKYLIIFPFMYMMNLGLIFHPNVANPIRVGLENGLVCMAKLSTYPALYAICLLQGKDPEIIKTIGMEASRVVAANKAKERTISMIVENYATVVMIVPFIEEIYYRFGVCKFFSVFSVARDMIFQNSSHRESNVKEEASIEKNKRDTKLFGVAPWAIVATIMFAVSHAGNYLPSPAAFLMLQKEMSDANSLSEAMRILAQITLPLMLALVSISTTGILSWNVLCPLYQERGLMAGFGAHVAWNFFELLRPWLLPLRLVRRLVLIIRDRLRIVSSRRSRKDAK